MRAYTGGVAREGEENTIKNLIEQRVCGGQVFTVVRDSGEVGTVQGSKDTSKQSITFRTGTDVRVEDWLVATDGAEHLILDTSTISDVSFNPQPIGVRAKYMTKRQYEREEAQSAPPPPSNITFGDFHGNPNVNTGQVSGGMHSGGNQTYDFRNIELEIQQRGGPEAEQLQEAVRELRERLESGQPIEPGMWARLAATLQTNSWITTPMGQALLNHLTGQTA